MKKRVFQSSGKKSITYKGKKYQRIKCGKGYDREYAKGIEKDYTCGDCGVSYNQYHDLSCDIEQCPICKEQLLSCGHLELFMTKEQMEEAKKSKMQRIMEVGIRRPKK